MDKNSLIQEIKNDLNSIKKQVEVTLAKLEVLEALYKLDVVKVETLESVSEKLEVKEPIVEPEPEPIVEPAPIVESEPVVESEPAIEPEPELEQAEVEVEVEVEPTPNSSLLTPNCEVATPNCETPVELRNLMSIIGLNDRFRFRHDLFSDSNDLFKETIEILNTIENFDKAVDYLQGKFKWNEEDATVVYFYEIIKPKF